jgi:hypothetical protein
LEEEKIACDTHVKYGFGINPKMNCRSLTGGGMDKCSSSSLRSTRGRVGFLGVHGFIGAREQLLHGFFCTMFGETDGCMHLYGNGSGQSLKLVVATDPVIEARYLRGGIVEKSVDYENKLIASPATDQIGRTLGGG